MILEGIVVTTNENGTPNISPMGPMIEDQAVSRFLLRPFQTSTTYKNLKRIGFGVLHVTDDVSIFVDGVLRKFESLPEVFTAEKVDGFVLEDCCRYFEFKVVDLNDSEERTEINCETVFSAERRAFFGFNRAKHAVLEAAILASRVHLIEHDEIAKQMKHLKIIVDKTAGEAESRSFAKIEAFLKQAVDDGEPPGRA